MRAGLCTKTAALAEDLALASLASKLAAVARRLADCAIVTSPFTCCAHLRPPPLAKNPRALPGQRRFRSLGGRGGGRGAACEGDLAFAVARPPECRRSTVADVGLGGDLIIIGESASGAAAARLPLGRRSVLRGDSIA